MFCKIISDWAHWPHRFTVDYPIARTLCLYTGSTDSSQQTKYKRCFLKYKRTSVRLLIQNCIPELILSFSYTESKHLNLGLLCFTFILTNIHVNSLS